MHVDHTNRRSFADCDKLVNACKDENKRWPEQSVKMMQIFVSATTIILDVTPVETIGGVKSAVRVKVGVRDF